MARPKLPKDVETQVLIASRRRCCLCFGLDQKDGQVKGQIAHVDRDPSNHAFANLAFLCTNHHDEYDSRTSQSKGLQKDELLHWRKELYAHFDSRVEPTKPGKTTLQLSGFTAVGPDDAFRANFRLHHQQGAELRDPLISIRLVDGIRGEAATFVRWPEHRRTPKDEADKSMREFLRDLFEPGGRVAMIRPLPENRPLFAGHSADFDGLELHLSSFPPGTMVELQYRIDAPGVVPILGSITCQVTDELATNLAEIQKKWSEHQARMQARGKEISAQIRAGMEQAFLITDRTF